MSKPGYDIRCAFRLPQKELEHLMQVVEAKGINRSIAIREAIRLYADFNSHHIKENL